jgi:hypothetical protein
MDGRRARPRRDRTAASRRAMAGGEWTGEWLRSPARDDHHRGHRRDRAAICDRLREDERPEHHLHGRQAEERELRRRRQRRARRRGRTGRRREGQHSRERAGRQLAGGADHARDGGRKSRHHRHRRRALRLLRPSQARLHSRARRRPGEARPGRGPRREHRQLHGAAPHFHVSDANSPLGSEGVPYVYDSVELVGACKTFTDCTREAPRRVRREMPMQNALVRFP